jgi:predicted transposase YbfD/YdcC
LPKKTVGAIIDSENDYVIGVKKNQPTLHQQIAYIISDRTKHSSSFVTLENNKGRREWRHTMVSNCINDIDKSWKGLQQVVGVHRIVIEKGEKREEMAYFISSLNSNALLYEEGIRSHWAIENSLHFVKDGTFKEDASKIITGNAPQNISTIKNISINILRTNQHTNMAQATRLVANDVKLLYDLII